VRYDGETFIEGLPTSTIRHYSHKLIFVPACVGLDLLELSGGSLEQPKVVGVSLKDEGAYLSPSQ
jgi:hypothetical protein